MRKFACLFLAAGLYAQTPQFEVATMKALPRGESGHLRRVDGSQFRYSGASLLSLVREAYRLKTPRQVQGPEWMRTQMYSIQARLPANSSPDQIPEMLQALLAERLKLSVHHESRLSPNNVLLVGRKGPKMRQATDLDEPLDLKLEISVVRLAGKASMPQLIDQFNHGLGGPDPWVDMTGLSGFYKIKLEYDMSRDSAAVQADDALGLPKLPVALEQQLGLRVEVRKAPTDIVVVDRAEKIPIEN